MNGLLKCSGESTTKNLGDYIQTVAQEQFWDKVDCYVEREALNTIQSDEPINVIMNGWFMWKPKNFPPSECINPLFTSIHINPKCAMDFFSEETVAYLKRYEPIGARDRGTQALLEQHGIKSYYSSCLTLTLGMKYKSEDKNGKIIFVDPYIFRKETPKLIVKSLMKACWHLLKHPLKAHRLTKKIDYNITRIGNYSKWLDRHLCMATFYDTYSKVFDDELLFNAEFVTHTVNNVDKTDDQKMELARERVGLYAGAKLVVTSRIHAALPCLGVETPVVFIPSSGLDATRENAGRFDGLEELFHVIRWVDGRLRIESESLKQQCVKGKLYRSVQVVNSNAYESYRDQLVETADAFCKGDTERLNKAKNTPPSSLKSIPQVAIISFVTNSSHLNYGATLHGYAFQKYLDKKCGVKSVIIDYLPKVVESDNLKYPILNDDSYRSSPNRVAVKISWGMGFFANLRRYNKFRRFLETQIEKTQKEYTYHTLQNAHSIDGCVFPVYVCESDVIWKVTTEDAFDENFFLDFPAAEGCKKVAYAPTLSSKRLSGHLLDKFQTLVSSFDAISAREEKGVAYLRELTGKQVDSVLDPTLLLDEEYYSEICIEPKEKKYLLIYNVTANDVEMVRESVRFAKEKGLKVIEISNYAINSLLVPHRVKVAAGIEEWLGYIRNAEVICTNSFHGFCFSLIFKKDVYLFQRDNSDYKMQNIADIFGMGSRMIPYNDKHIPKNETEIDYETVYQKLMEFRKRSTRFINENIITTVKEMKKQKFTPPF